MTPPPAAMKKSSTVSLKMNVPLTAAITAARYRMSAVASFTRLSPSRIVTTRCGRPNRFATAVAETASGGETIAPKAMAPAQPNPGRQMCATTATAAVVANTRPTASRVIGRRFERKSRHEVK